MSLESTDPDIKPVDRDAAWAFVCEHVQDQGLRRHMLAVETAMRAYACKLGEDEARWGAAGLLHDFDWEIHPTKEEHPELGCRMLEEAGWPPDIVRAIRGHATYLGVARDTPMAKALFACDELTGFIGAVVAVRPNKTIREVTVESVRKKLKDKRFAAKVDRDEVDQGALEFGVDLDEHIAFLIEALTANAQALGL
jgi:putative nucleotidyltransferase with HDIG domain